MKLPASLCAASAALLVAATALGAAEPAYPDHEVHFICAIAPGSGADVIVRFFAEKMRVLMGVPVIVENRTGATGNIATEYVARAKPDGYTVYVHAGSSVAANMHLFKKPPVDVATALQVAATINRQPFMVVVDAKAPWKTLPELTAAMKAKGDKATYATVGPLARVMGALYNRIAGLKAVEVQYKTAMETLNDMASGSLDYAMQDPQFSLAQARAGRLRILAVSTATRLDAVPDLPTMAEQGVPGMDLMGWFAAMVPAATPKPVVDRLNGWFGEAVGSAEAKTFLNSFGGDPWIATPEQGQARLLADIGSWAEYVRVAKIEPQG